MILEATFTIAMLLSMISGRTMLLSYRSGIQRPLNAYNAVMDIVSLIAGLAFWPNIVWGFSALDWYLVLPIIGVTAIVGGILPNPPRFEFFYKADRFTDFCAVVLTVWLWIWNWPY